MSSKRYIIHMAPIEHVNGKLARQAQRVKNADNSSPSADAFYYGYRVQGRSVSRFGLREIPRNLTTNPYTTSETDNKSKFASSVDSAKQVMSSDTLRANAWIEFCMQKKYIRLYNYIISRCRDHGGEIPNEWLSGI